MRVNEDAEWEGQSSPTSERRSIYQAAVRYLAMREHCQSELRQKLQQRFPDQTAEIEPIVTQLSESGLQSDQRYIEVLIRSRVAKGYGSIYIRQQLRQQQLDDQLCQVMLASAEVDWTALAKQVYDKKYGKRAASLAEKAKRYRFLQSRGFSVEEIRQVC